jgi:hypothetical protein
MPAGDGHAAVGNEFDPGFEEFDELLSSSDRSEPCRTMIYEPEILGDSRPEAIPISSVVGGPHRFDRLLDGFHVSHLDVD